MKIFDLTLKATGYPIDQARLELDKILAVPEDSYSEYLAEKRREIVEFHLKNNQFYCEIAPNTNAHDWSSVPVMQKIDFQRPLPQRLSKGYSEKTVYINKTSGSSGDPMVFAKDKPCHALIWANIMRRFSWYGVDFNRSWQARFYGMTLDYKANKLLRLKDFLSRRYRFSIFDLSDKGLEKIVTGFRKRNFHYINGYTSVIVQLAKYLQRQDLVLTQVCPSLKVCITTSEMLFEHDRLLLETQLGVPVVNEYGASELEVIAFQNPQGEWLVNAETLFVEILDYDNKPVPNGQEGRIVVTSLNNKAHPFIRYEVGDLGILDEKSTAKKPLLKKLTGRTNDVAILPSGKRPAGMTFYTITKKLFEDDGNVKEFLIRQTKMDTFEIDYTSTYPLTAAEISRIETVMTQYLEPGLNYIFNQTELLQRSKSGKLKQFTRQFEAEKES